METIEAGSPAVRTGVRHQVDIFFNVRDVFALGHCLGDVLAAHRERAGEARPSLVVTLNLVDDLNDRTV